jgi:hypothetical protein
MTLPIALTDRQLREVQTIALGVPYHLRARYLEEVAALLRDKGDLGDGMVHRVARAIANRIVWDSGRTAVEA